MPPSCDDQQAAYLDGDPDATDHLSGCPVCVLERASLDDIKSTLSEESMWIEPPPDLEARVIAATRADELSARRGSRRGGRLGRGPIWVAAAACVICGLVGAGTVKLLDRPPPFSQQVALSGTPNAPQASAVAHARDTPAGVEIHLEVKGLPTTPTGSYYEAWLKGPIGLVPIGTFHTGNGQITLWSGVPLDTHPTLTVTIQSDNGDPASSGRQVLVGKLNR